MRKVIFGTIAMLVSSVVLTACSSNEDFYDPDMGHKAKAAEYEQAFTQEFGTVAKGHTWGFERSRVTRGAVTYTETNYELPEQIDNEGKTKKYVEAFEAEQRKVDAGQASNFVSSIPAKEFDFSKPYFMQHVHQAQFGNNNGGNGNYTLQARDFSKTIETWVTVTGFVKGKNESTMTSLNQTVKGVTLMENMGTPIANAKMFQWVNASGTAFPNYQFLKIEGEWYLGLWNEMKNNKPRSWWVIKLLPAVQKTDIADEGTLFCEDLGDTDDFDFNDLVADVIIRTNGNIEITVKAHGGEFDIKIAETLVTVKRMCNTGWNSDNTQTILISGDVAKEKGWLTIKDIPIEVIPGGDAQSYVLDAEVGGVPQKILVPRGLEWPTERTNIRDAYDDFKDYVNSMNPEDWHVKQNRQLVYPKPTVFDDGDDESDE